MNKIPELTDNRLILRKIKESDIEQRLLLGYDSEIEQFCGRTVQGKLSENDVEKWYQRIIDHPCKWVIEFEDEFIGVTSLRLNPENNKAKLAIEILNPKYLNRGIGGRVVNLVLGYAFTICNYHSVYLRVIDYNKRAIKCYEKNGFKVDVIADAGAFIGELNSNDVYMEISQSEYNHTRQITI